MKMNWKIGLLTLICVASAQARSLPEDLSNALMAPLSNELNSGATPIQPPSNSDGRPTTPSTPSTQPSTPSHPSEGGQQPVIEPLYTCQLPKNEEIGLKEDMLVIVFRQNNKLNLVVADKAVKRGIPYEDIQAHLVSDEAQVQKLMADEKMATVLKIANLSDVSSVKKVALFNKEKPEGSDSKILPMALFVFADGAGKGLGGVMSIGGLLQSPCNPLSH